MMWLEMLAAALFTFKATNSTVAVTVVSACRSLPLLVKRRGYGRHRGCNGSQENSAARIVAGERFVGDSWSLVFPRGSIDMAPCAAALVSGVVYATEMPARRRMIAETAGTAMASRAVAIDSMTNFATRCLGPLLGGLIYGALGVSTSYFLSATASLCAAACIYRLSSVQAPSGRLSLTRIRKDLQEAWQYALNSKTIMALLIVTTITNLCGYSYNVLLTPLRRETFDLSATMIGVLSAAEPAGSFVAGAIIGGARLRGRSLVWLIAGSSVLFLAIAIAGFAS
ncbi:MFS transporter [Caballeronia arvi]|nr:MFS transporter [Caballeronia arvi]